MVFREWRQVLRSSLRRLRISNLLSPKSLLESDTFLRIRHIPFPPLISASFLFSLRTYNCTNLRPFVVGSIFSGISTPLTDQKRDCYVDKSPIGSLLSSIPLPHDLFFLGWLKAFTSPNTLIFRTFACSKPFPDKTPRLLSF